MVIDTFSALPFEIIAASLGASVPLRVINLIRLCRVTRIVKLRSAFHLIDFIPKALKILMISVAVMIAIHWLACGRMVINPRTEPDNISFYIVSLYWAITTLTTVGYGDITPTTNISRIYTMGVMLVGVGVYGVIIAQFSRLMMLVDKYTEERKEKMNGLSQYLKYYNIPTSLQRQVFSFYNHVLTKTVSDKDDQVINYLHQALQQELNIYTKIKLIKNVHILKECSTPCLKMIAQKLEQTFHSPNEYIIRKGDAGEEMFIIGHGEVQVTQGEKTLAELKSGQFFGEIALIEDTIRTADVQSKA
jgi:voltage-gated potassium channel